MSEYVEAEIGLDMGGRDGDVISQAAMEAAFQNAKLGNVPITVNFDRARVIGHIVNWEPKSDGVKLKLKLSEDGARVAKAQRQSGAQKLKFSIGGRILEKVGKTIEKLGLTDVAMVNSVEPGPEPRFEAYSKEDLVAYAYEAERIIKELQATCTAQDAAAQKAQVELLKKQKSLGKAQDQVALGMHVAASALQDRDAVVNSERLHRGAMDFFDAVGWDFYATWRKAWGIKR